MEYVKIGGKTHIRFRNNLHTVAMIVENTGQLLLLYPKKKRPLHTVAKQLTQHQILNVPITGGLENNTPNISQTIHTASSPVLSVPITGAWIQHQRKRSALSNDNPN